MANVGYIDAGDWLKYHVNAVETSDYYLYLRVAAAKKCCHSTYGG
jgi:hypothetical protein